MEAPPPSPFSKREATVFLVGAVVTFVVGVIALALGWIEVASACAGVFAIGWLGMRSRIKRVAREREEAEREAQAAEAPKREPRRPGDLSERRSARRRPRP